MNSTIHATVLSLVNGPVVGPSTHAAATVSILLALAGWLTPILTAIAVFLSIVWYAITIYESKTFKSFAIRFRMHIARVMKIKGPHARGQKMAESVLVDAKAVVAEVKSDAVLAKDTQIAAQQLVRSP